MSVRFDANTDRLTRTSTLPSITAFTLMAWVYRSAATALNYEAPLALGSASASYVIYTRHGGLDDFAVTNWATDYVGSPLTTATWYHLAMTCAGTGAGQLLGYLNGALNITGNGSASVTAGTLQCSSSVPDPTGEWFNGRLAALKVYGAVLTEGEIKAEMRSIMPVRTLNLNTWAPFLTSADVTNYAGTGAWTVGGTLTTEDGPPVAWSVRPTRRAVRFVTGTTRNLTAALAAISTTPTSLLTTERLVPASLLGGSTTPEAVGAQDRSLTAALLGASTTPEALATLPTTRALTAAVAGASVTADAVAALVTMRALTADLLSLSTTPASLVTVARALTSTLDGVSATPPSLSQTQHALTAALVAISTTPAAIGGTGEVTVPLTAVLTGSSTTAALRVLLLTGARFPSLGESVAEGVWADDAWTTPGNVQADDGATASVTAATYDAGDQTQVLKAYNFNFADIPDGARIEGVTCVVNAWWAAGTASMDLLQLLDPSRAKVGTNQCATAVVLPSTTTNLVTKGSPTDLWGNALTAVWVKDPNFGVAIGILATAANTDVHVDFVTLEIAWSPPLALTAQLLAPSVTPDAGQTMERSLAAGVIASSTTPPVLTTSVRLVAAMLSAASTTPASVGGLLRELTTRVQGSSSTPEATVELPTLRALTATLMGMSATPDSAAVQERALTASLLGTSTTPVSLVTTVRRVTAAVHGTSTTPDSVGTSTRLLVARLSGSSMTRAPAATLQRGLTGMLVGMSATALVVSELLSAANFGESLSVAAGASHLIPASTHGYGHPHLRVQVYDNAMPRQRIRPGPIRVHPTSFLVTVPFLQAQSGLVVINAGTLDTAAGANQGYPFTNASQASPFVIAGTTHNYGHANLLVDVYDTAGVLLPEIEVTVHPTTFDVTVRPLQAQSGLVVLCGMSGSTPVNSSTSFTNATQAAPVVIPGITHGRGTANLGVQLYDTAGVEVHGRVTVDPSTFDVTATFLQPQSGTLVLNGTSVSGVRVLTARVLGVSTTADTAVDIAVGITPNYASSFPASTTVTRDAAAHGLGTRDLRVQVYDTATIPGVARRVAGQITVHPTTFTIEVTFLQAVTGFLVAQGALALPGPQGNYGGPFSAAPTYTLPGSVHGFGTANLLVDVYDTAGVLLPFTPVDIDLSTFDLTLTFAQNQTGWLVVSAGAGIGLTPNLGTSFTAGTAPQTVTVLGTTHAYGTRNIGVQIYDDSTPARVMQAQVVVHPATLNVTATFLQPQNGRLVLNASQQARLLTATLVGSSATTAAAVTSTRPLVAAPSGLSLTPASASAVLRPLTSSLTGVSVTRDATASLTAVRALLAALVGSSVVPDVLVTTARVLTSSLAGVSTTPPILQATTRPLVAALSGTSATPASAVTTVRSLTSSLTGASSTRAATATLAALRALTAAITGSSTCPASLVTLARSLTAAVAVVSTTPPTLVTTQRLLVAQLSGPSTTQAAAATLAALRELTAFLTGTSATPSSTVSQQRSLRSAITGHSLTPATVVTMVRLLTSVLTGTSTTAAALTSVQRPLVASLSGISVTGEAAMVLTALRELAATLPGMSTTPAALVTQQHLLTAGLRGASVTADVPAVVNAIRSFTATLVGTSSTPRVGPTQQRTLVSHLDGLSVTERAEMTTVRLLTAALAGTSVTPVAVATQQRRLTTALTGSSLTPATLVTLVRQYTATLRGTSVTRDSSSTVLRPLSASLAASSTTRSAAVVLTGLRILAAEVRGFSDTLRVDGRLSRTLSSGIAGTSTTPAALVTTLRPLTAGLFASSTTPQAALINTFALVSRLQGTSLTPPVPVLLARALTGVLAGTGLTPPSLVQSLRLLQAALTGTSETLASTGLLVVGLSSQLTGSSTTADSTPALARAFVAALAGVTQTSAGTVTTERPLTAILVGSSTTPLALFIPNSGEMACRAGLVGSSRTSAIQLLTLPWDRVGTPPPLARKGVAPARARIGVPSAAARVAVMVTDDN